MAVDLVRIDLVTPSLTKYLLTATAFDHCFHASAVYKVRSYSKLEGS